MSTLPLERLVRKEVSLGAIRAIEPPSNFIGLRLAPFMEVDTDDVTFQYIKDTAQESMVPARAEDAEAELRQNDDFSYGQGRARIMDWAFKNKYTASDVTRYRDNLRIQQALQGAGVDLRFNEVGRGVDEFQRRVARDDASRRRDIDVRIEWLIMSAMATSKIELNDGKVKFSVDFKRPADQRDVTPEAGKLWTPENADESDPIGFVKDEIEKIYERTGVRPNRGILSQKIVNDIWRSKRFLAAVGFPILTGEPNIPLDVNYLSLRGYSAEGALKMLEEATGVTFEIYDAFYRSRPFGSTVTQNVRFVGEDKVILYPSQDLLGEIDDTEIGFAKTLTSPHPEGNFTPGFYEWEDETKDPWMHVRGSGIKAFPIFPYLKYTSVLKVR